MFKSNHMHLLAFPSCKYLLLVMEFQPATFLTHIKNSLWLIEKVVLLHIFQFLKIVSHNNLLSFVARPGFIIYAFLFDNS